MTIVRAARAVVFDLDGTLVDTVGVRVAAWMDVFPSFGIEPDPAWLATLMGSDGKLLARRAAESVGKELEPGIDAEIDRIAGERFRELNRQPVALPGANEILEFLDEADLPWAIATSSRPEEVGASIESLGLRLEPLVIDGGDVEHAKPAPDLLLKASDRLGVEAEDIWYVGDAKWDMLAATAAGMVGLAVTTGATDASALEEAGAVRTFEGLAELLGYISSDALAPDRGTRDMSAN